MGVIRSIMSTTCVRFSLAAACLIVATAGLALAQTDKDRVACFSLNREDYKDPKKFDADLAACDRMIASKKYTGKALASILRARGSWLQKKGNLDAALEAYGRAIALDPNDVEGYDYRADVWQEKGNFERAIAEYSQAIRIDPTYPAAYYSRGRVYEKLGKIDRAREDYNAALVVPSKNRIGDWAHQQAQKRLDELSSSSGSSPPH
jgi:tetratricopeptide (TPR) repeat protein